ncbi:hypothetical protein [Kineococcus glutinatus]|uniref:Uncharacterized protein n=1 Tax=Kineococcus glutinatus TaxID=1070872 RepID=A0ABP9HRE0_9ACTN
MPLTVYTADALALTWTSERGGGALLAHLLVIGSLAWAWRAALGRGPLEEILAAAARGAAALVTGPVRR